MTHRILQKIILCDTDTAIEAKKVSKKHRDIGCKTRVFDVILAGQVILRTINLVFLFIICKFARD